MKKSTLYYCSLFFISSALLSFEIALMRVLRIEGFSSFTYTAISIALTGFGASGTIAFLLRRQFQGKERELSYYAAIGFIFFYGLSYSMSKYIQFDPLQLLWDKNQIFRLIIRIVLYILPFFCGSFFVMMAFFTDKPSVAYFYNLLGSGSGIIIILFFLYLLSPEEILLIPLLLSCSALLFLIPSIYPLRFSLITGLFVMGIGIILYFTGGISPLPYKDIKRTLHLPDAKIIARYHSPYGSIDVVQSKMIRVAPGLSLNFKGTLPLQYGIFLDGDFISVIDRISGGTLPAYFDFQIQDAVYKLYTNPEVYIYQLGGGIPVLRAVRNNAKKIIVNEENPAFIYLLKRRFADDTSDLFDNPSIIIQKGNPRRFLEGTSSKFSIIDISIADNSLSTIGGIYASATNYTLTTDAFSEYYRHLKKEGTLSISFRTKLPPRDLLRIIATLHRIHTTEGLRINDRLIVLRSWDLCTVLAKKSPFTPDEVNRIVKFAQKRSFDLVYYPGITKKQTSRFIHTRDTPYFIFVQRLLADPSWMQGQYAFDIRPTSDDRPYFSYFIKISNMAWLFKKMGTHWLYIIEGGYIIVFATFIVSLFIAFGLIMLPFLIKAKRIPHNAMRLLIYFGCIALAYMFVEVILIETAKRYFTPIFSNSIILSSLLIFSGLGSYFSERFKLSIAIIAISIAAYFIFYLFILKNIALNLLILNDYYKMGITIISIAPLGFLMGMPFPMGFLRVKSRSGIVAAWAWSINGYFSVVASSGAVLLSSNVGFYWMGICAVLLYLLTIISQPEN